MKLRFAASRISVSLQLTADILGADNGQDDVNLLLHAGLGAIASPAARRRGDRVTDQASILDCCDAHSTSAMGLSRVGLMRRRRSRHVRFAPKATELLRRREMTRSAISSHL
jgi:hypothetical protein